MLFRSEKKFLPGMKAKGAVMKIGRGEEIWLCEGYATGLSIHKALSMLNISNCVVCTFSAGNMEFVGKNYGNYIFADHDPVGIRCAEATGKPWVTTPVERMDANDFHSQHGILQLARLIKDFRNDRRKAELQQLPVSSVSEGGKEG